MESLFIPERLKKIREDRGLNKAEAARLLGLSKMGYLRYESADRTPSHQTIVFMAQKLGTSPDYLIGITEDPRPNEYVISKSDDPVLFELIADVIDKKNPARDRLLAYYRKLKASKPVNTSALSGEEIDAELEKGYADMKAGRTKSAKSAFAGIRKGYNL